MKNKLQKLISEEIDIDNRDGVLYINYGDLSDRIIEFLKEELVVTTSDSDTDIQTHRELSEDPETKKMAADSIKETADQMEIWRDGYFNGFLEGWAQYLKMINKNINA